MHLFLLRILTLLFGIALCSAQSPTVRPWIPLPTSVYSIKGPGSLYKQHPHTLAENRNPENVRVFIAIALRDAEGLLRGGVWNEALLTLVDILGPHNTFVSIFENDSVDGTATALKELKDRIKAPSSVVSEHLLESSARNVTRKPLRRIRHLANVRNRVLRPFYEQHQSEFANDPSLSKPYDRILWINDVFFDPYNILSLILETNGGFYSAACGLDYINPVSMYDYFAVRDAEGKLPESTRFPYFRRGKSMDQMVDPHTRDIEVKSCWGGVTAFDAQPFYDRQNLTFRDSESDEWEASECCLIHADIGTTNSTFINSAVKVAYDEWTFSWLTFASNLEQWWYYISQLAMKMVPTILESSIDNPRSVSTPLLRPFGVHQLNQPSGPDGFCSWPFMMYMGKYDETQAQFLRGDYRPEHQDGPNSTYWILTV